MSSHMDKRIVRWMTLVILLTQNNNLATETGINQT